MEKFLEDLLNIDSPSGYTLKACEFIKTEFEKLGYEVVKNKKGNLEVFVDFGKETTLGLSAHVDTLGFIVRSINGDGTLNVNAVGGPIFSTVNGEYCNIYTRDNRVYKGTILNKASAVHVYKEARDKVLEENLIVRLDEKVFSKEDVSNLGIDNGDFVCYDPKVQFVNDFVKARFLDDKAAVAILFELLKLAKDPSFKSNYNLHLIVSTYEEVGHGASNIPSNIDEMIAIDMGCVGKDLNGSDYKVSICAKDSSGPYDYEMTTKLIEKAKSEKIDYAIDVYPMYGSDASAALRAGNDIRAALIGPGVNASHGMERTTKQAITNTTKLIMAYIK